MSDIRTLRERIKPSQTEAGDGKSPSHTIVNLDLTSQLSLPSSWLSI